MSRPWSDSTKRAFAIGMVLVLALAAYQFRTLISPLAIAVIIAYILTPLVDNLVASTRLPRSLAVLLVDVVALAVVGVIPAIVAPTLIAEAGQINLDLQSLLDQVQSAVSGRTTLLGIELNLDQLFTETGNALRDLVQPLISQSVFLLIDVASGLLWAIFIFVISFYLMRDWHRVTSYLENVVPPGYREDYTLLLARVGRIWHSFFRGQVILSLVVGTAVTVSMAVLGVRNALVLGLLAGLLEVVPNVGPVVSAIPAVLLALLQGSGWIPLGHLWFALAVVGTYTLIQQVENNYLVPRIIGGSVNLHPLVVLVGAIAGARVAGILGIFLAAPTLASARVILGYIYAKLLDLEPFSAEDTCIVRPECAVEEKPDLLTRLREWLRSASRLLRE